MTNDLWELWILVYLHAGNVGYGDTTFPDAYYQEEAVWGEFFEKVQP